MRIHVDDSYYNLGQIEYIRERNRDFIEKCILENIQIDNDEFEVNIHNYNGDYKNTEVGNIERSLYIMLNSSHTSAMTDTLLIEGKATRNTDKYGELLRPTGIGTIFYDEDVEPVAEYRGMANDGTPICMLNILFDITYSDEAWEQFTKIIKRFNEKIIKPLNLSRGTLWEDGKDKGDLLKSIVDKVEEQKEREIISIKSYIESYENDIEATKRRIAELTGKLRNSFIKVKALEDSKEDGHEKISNDLNLIVELDKVKELRIKDNKIIVYTNVIHIHDEEGNKYYGGEYEIEISLNYFDVTFRNRTEGRKGFWTMNDPHPHINGGTGKACWGNLSSTIAELCSQNELYAVTLSAIDFLENVDIHEWAGGHVVNWDSVDEDGNRIPPDPDVLDPTEKEQEEDSWYCEYCDEYHNQDEHMMAYEYITVINEGEDFDYGDEAYICEREFEYETVYCEEADESTFEIRYRYEESEEWRQCLHCGGIHHLDGMVEVFDEIEVNEDEGSVIYEGDIIGHACENSCSDYYGSFYAEEDGMVYYADQIDYQEVEED